MDENLIDLTISSVEDARPEIAGLYPEIIVSGTKNKPYFQIKYFDINDKSDHIGFGSYCLDYVFDWLKEYFDSERTHINKIGTTSAHVEKEKTMGEWISVKDRLPKYGKEVLTYTPGIAIPITVDVYDRYYGEDNNEWYEGWRYRGSYAENSITHWMSLPEMPEEK